MDEDSFKLMMECKVCGRCKTIGIPAGSLERAKEIFKEIVNLLDHPTAGAQPVKDTDCSGQWQIVSEKK